MPARMDRSPRVRLAMYLAVMLATVLVLAPDVSRSQDDYESWLRDQQQQFQDYLTEQDRQFSNWLQEQWREFEALQGVKRDEAPKPPDVPVAPPPDDKPAPPPPPTRDAPPPPPPRPIPEVETPPPHRVTPPPPPPRDQQRGTHETTLRYFELDLRLATVDVAGVARLEKVDENGVSGFWKAMSRLPQDAMLTQLNHYREELGLNDWGYALLLRAVGDALFPGDSTRTTLTVWYLLLKSGYDARVGFWQNNVHLLLPSQQTMYQTPFFDIEGRRYYFVSPGAASSAPGKLMIFEGDYPGSEAPVDLRLARMPALGREVLERKVSFEFDGRRRDVALHCDGTALKFLASLPLTDLEVYFTAPMSRAASTSLLDALQSQVEDLPPQRAVDLLLRFVQRGFPYQTDGEQFGREKYMFAEEVFFYPYSDCEDRSVLFRYLVENLLGLEVVGLSYPGHVATAVAFAGDVGGDAVMVDRRRFVICDPTYMNANAGMCMPRFRQVTPEVLSFH